MKCAVTNVRAYRVNRLRKVDYHESCCGFETWIAKGFMDNSIEEALMEAVMGKETELRGRNAEDNSPW